MSYRTIGPLVYIIIGVAYLVIAYFNLLFQVPLTMAFALVLFDYDGMTDIVPTKDCGENVPISSKCEIKYHGKKHLVEVLQTSGKS